MPTVNTQNSYRRTVRNTSTLLSTGAVTVLEETAGEIPLGHTTRITVSNPDWRVKIAKGENVTNPYRYTGFRNIQPASIYANALQTSGGVYSIEARQRRLDASYTLIGPTTDAALLSIASLGIKKKLRSKTDEFRSMTPLVEFRDLAKAVRSVAKLSTEFLFEYSKSRKKSLKQNARDKERWMADAWLTYNFGLAPLVRDVSTAVSSIESYLNRSSFPVRLSSASSKQWVSSSKQRLSNANNMTIESSNVIQHTLSYRITAGFDLKVLSSNNYSAAQHLGLDLRLVPVTLYELTGFSWMADYFVNVGAYLEDLFYVPPGTTKYLSVFRRYEASCQVNLWTQSINSNTKLGTLQVTPGTWEFFDVERTSLSNLPSVQLRFKTQDEMGMFAVTKLLNMLSVLRK